VCVREPPPSPPHGVWRRQTPLGGGGGGGCGGGGDGDEAHIHTHGASNSVWQQQTLLGDGGGDGGGNGDGDEAHIHTHGALPSPSLALGEGRKAKLGEGLT